MPVVIDETYLPARLTAPPMTDEDFEAFCAEHPDCFIEMTADGELLIMPPAYWLTSARGAEILYQLKAWSRTANKGLVIDASGGFRLRSGARRSPDAAWLSRRSVEGLQTTGPARTWLLCPEFVIELRSETDRLPPLRAKMREWIQNGAELAWLIDPARRTVEIYRPRQTPQILTEATHVPGEGPVAGFLLDLRPVWEPLAP